MNIAVFSFKNNDYTEGISELLEQYGDQKVTVLAPILTPLPKFYESIVKAVTERKKKFPGTTELKFFFISAEGYDEYLKYADDLVVTENPMKEILRTLTAEDTIGIAWTDTAPCHYILHSIEDLGIEPWDISDGLIPLETDEFDFDLDSEDIHDRLIETMGEFVDLLAAFVANTVMESLGQAVAEHILNSEGESDKKDFNPFKDME